MTRPTPSKLEALTPRKRRFVEEYLIDLNATQAATRAGYKLKKSHAHVADLLADPAIQVAIAELQEARSKATGITAERIMRELAIIGFATKEELQEWGGRVSDKVAACTQMGRHLGMFVDKQEHSGQVSWVLPMPGETPKTATEWLARYGRHAEPDA